MNPAELISERLARGGVVLLSGGFSTELHRRGVRTELPLWSAGINFSHPDLIVDVHKDYIRAGAHIITANTFRTNLRTFRKAGQPERAAEATKAACALALRARAESDTPHVVVAGSVASVEDCYSPELTPPDNELIEEHTALATWLKNSGVDLILIETMPTIREAKIAAEAARAVGLPFMVSFVCTPDGNVLSGEPIEDAVAAISPFGPLAFSTNCRPLPVIRASVERLLKATKLPVGVYANGDGEPDDEVGWRFLGNNHEAHYLENVTAWLQKGAKVVGGCCGTTPEYIHSIRALLP